jgi:MFS superfamily sulfate permease-like transporter
MIELGRRRGTTSWEPYDAHHVDHVDHVLVVMFDEDLFFANAGVFRRELHTVMQKYPKTQHVVIDAVAITDIDFTGITTLSQIVDDMSRDHVSLSMARANAALQASIGRADDPQVRAIAFYDSVDDAATHAAHTKS